MGWRMTLLGAFTSLPAFAWVGPPNPQFPITMSDAREDLRRMGLVPIRLQRPVLVLGGWRSPPPLGMLLTQRLREVTSGKGDDFLSISYPLQTDFERIARLVVEQVQRTWPSDDPAATVEVDAVGFSMGGLVARLAAMPAPERRRLRIRRLFTLGTPHRGARLAGRIAPDGAARDMRPGSDFLERIDDALSRREYDLVCYAHLNDQMVGATNASPPGFDPHWVSGTLAFSHYTTTTDRRIRADLARRLRGERPHALDTSRPPRD